MRLYFIAEQTLLEEGGMHTASRYFAAISAGLLFQQPAPAQQYPDRPVRLIVPFAPGGTTDILARTLGQAIGENLGQQVISDNRPGASGNLGTAIAAKSPPDGYTLLLGVISPLAINVTVYEGRLPYHPLKDFAPVSLITKVPQVIAMHPSVPAKTLKELIALAKAQPKRLNFGSGGTGTSNHLVGELIKSATGIQIQHVPFKGAGPASVAVLSGEVDMMVSAPPAVIHHFRSGRLRALVVSSLKRSPALPEVPTVAESGIPGFDATAWYCMVVPAATPVPIIQRVRTALVTAMETPAVRDKLMAEGAVPESSTPEELRAFIAAEIPKWAKAVKLAGVKVD
jgi:tripartite-type tricarboxylate transporter receptor subunit TctC